MMHRNSQYEEQAEDVGREVGRRADELQEAAASRARRVKAQARDWVDRGAQGARASANAVRDEALAAGRRAERYVHDQPIKTAVAAAATGALIGGLLVWLLREPRR